MVRNTLDMAGNEKGQSGGSAFNDIEHRGLDEVHAEITALRRELNDRAQEASEQAERNVLVEADLQHRARNTMALVRSIFGRTIDTALTLDDVKTHFCGRLDVLARYQLARGLVASGRLDLESILRDELRAFSFGDARGIEISGPAIGVPAHQAQSFALAIHELVTNAVKFGALAFSGANLSITWGPVDRGVELTWRETGVTIISGAPFRKGFGREFIEEGLPYETGASTTFDLQPGGIICTISLPACTSA